MIFQALLLQLEQIEAGLLTREAFLNKFWQLMLRFKNSLITSGNVVVTLESSGGTSTFELGPDTDKYNKKDPLKEEYRSGMKLYRENDKILQLKNYADEDVYNGDIGILEMIDLKQKSFIVNFDAYNNSVF